MSATIETIHPNNGLDKTEVELICLDIEAIVPLMKYAESDARGSLPLLHALMGARINCLRDLIEGRSS